jgi:hypothetical protein
MEKGCMGIPYRKSLFSLAIIKLTKRSNVLNDPKLFKTQKRGHK